MFSKISFNPTSSPDGFDRCLFVVLLPFVQCLLLPPLAVEVSFSVLVLLCII